MEVVIKHPTYSITTTNWLLHERKEKQTHADTLLLSYFNDLYHLFLSKLVTVTQVTTLSELEEKKLTNMLDELLKVKALIAKENK